MMTSSRPQVGDRDLLTATQACRVLGCSLSALRGYVRDGLIPFRVNKSNGRRLFVGRNIIALWRSRH